MARYVLTADVDFEGLPYKRGDILNAPQGLPETVARSASLQVVPRARIAGLQYDYPNLYLAVATADRLGLQQITQTFPPDASGNSNVIPEPRLPTTNSQYD
ncbi:MAG: hypothetical protein AB7L09_00470 [Nitrospira sp.]